MDSQSRQEFVRAAVVFLQNPQLVDSSLQDKLKFLRNKGLSDIEVDEALNLALVKRNQSPGGKWNFLLVLGLCIGGYKLYQAYVESKTRLATKQQPRIVEADASNAQRLSHARASDQNNSGQLKPEDHQPTLNDILQKMAELKKLIELQRTNMGAEIQSLKTLLLSHERFAAPPKIPAWQLGDVDNSDETPADKDTTSPAKSPSVATKKKTPKERKAKSEAQQAASNGIITETPIAPIPE